MRNARGDDADKHLHSRIFDSVAASQSAGEVDEMRHAGDGDTTPPGLHRLRQRFTVAHGKDVTVAEPVALYPEAAGLQQCSDLDGPSVAKDACELGRRIIWQAIGADAAPDLLICT